MRSKIGFQPLFTLMVLLISADFAHARNADFSVDLLSDLRFLENANQSLNEDEQIDEFEWRNSLNFDGAVRGEWVSTVSDFRIMDRRYSEQDDRNEQLFLGELSVTLGPSQGRTFAELKHSEKEMLVDPIQSDSPDNLDRRSVSSIILSSAIKPTSANEFNLAVDFSDIQFKYSELNEASRTGVAGQYLRYLSPTSQFGVNLSAYHLEYRYEDNGFDNTLLSVMWMTELRRLNYKIEVGASQLDRNGERTTEPYFDFQFGYEGGLHSVEIDLNRWISDTSQGGSGRAEVGEVSGQNGRVDVVDQLERTELTLDWGFRAPCAACRLELTYDYASEEYFTSSFFDSDQERFRAVLHYDLSAKIDTFIGYVWDGFDYLERPTEESYQQVKVSAGIIMHNIIKDASLEFFAGQLTRDFDGAGDYTSGFIGFIFVYEIYDR